MQCNLSMKSLWGDFHHDSNNILFKFQPQNYLPGGSLAGNIEQWPSEVPDQLSFMSLTLEPV